MVPVQPDTGIAQYEEYTWLIGDGRSGTTWLSGLLNVSHKSQSLVEPFHPHKVDELRHMALFEYMPGNSEPWSFDAFSERLFAGHLVADSDLRLPLSAKYPTRLLIKDIFAHLFAHRIKQRYPFWNLVLLMRHPFDVALSKLQKPEWHWLGDASRLLNQPLLKQDYLADYQDCIHATSGDFEHLVLVWAIIHHIWMRQFDESEYHLMHYEQLCSEPTACMAELAAYLKRSSAEAKLMQFWAAKSGREHFDLIGAKTGWRGRLDAGQIERGYDILETFGMDRFYPRDH